MLRLSPLKTQCREASTTDLVCQLIIEYHEKGEQRKGQPLESPKKSSKCVAISSGFSTMTI